MSDNPQPEDAVQLIRTMTVHIGFVRECLLVITQNLQRRGEVHDRSKFYADEFDGFTRINQAAREHPYGSEEYRAGLRQEKPSIQLHYQRNTHHPEHHDLAESHIDGMYRAEVMGFLDIIEMVCDWRSAYLAYGSQGSWEDNIQKQRKRYKDWFSAGQWWLIEQVAKFIGESVRG